MLDAISYLREECDRAGATYSSQLLVLVEWIPTQAHDHGMDLGLFFIELTRRWAIDVVIGTAGGDLGVTEIHAQRCDVHHLRERLVWQISYPPRVSLSAWTTCGKKLTGGAPEVLPAPSETLLDRPGEIDRERFLGSLSPDDLWSRRPIGGGLGDWTAVG